MVGAASTPFNKSSWGLVLTLTLSVTQLLLVTQLLVELLGGGWGGGGCSAKQPFLGDGPSAIGIWSWFLLGLFSTSLGSGFGCFDAPLPRRIRRGEIGLRGQNASPVPFGPGPNTCDDRAGWWCGVGPRSSGLELSLSDFCSVSRLFWLSEILVVRRKSNGVFI
jgi:hypothetical protein